MCIYLNFACLYGSKEFLGIAHVLLFSMVKLLFLTHLTTQLHPLSSVILSPLICVGSSYCHDFNLKMLASYLFLWAVPSSGSRTNLFWFSDIIFPSSSHLTSSAPSVHGISSLQHLLPRGKYPVRILSFFPFFDKCITWRKLKKYSLFVLCSRCSVLLISFHVCGVK